MALRASHHPLIALVAMFLAFGARADVAIPIAGVPRDLTVNPITHEIWVTSEASDHVVVIDGVDHSVETVALADRPLRARVDPVRNRVWIAHAGPLVSVVDGATRAVSTIPLPSATSLALDPFRGLVYAPVPGAIALIDADTLAVTTVPTSASGTVAVDATIDGLATVADAGGQFPFVAHRLAGDPPAVVASVQLFMSHPATGLALDLHTGRAIVGSFDAGPTVVDWQAGILFPSDFIGFSSYGPVAEPTAGRTWIPSNDPFTCSASFLYAFDTATLAQHGSNAFVPCFDRVAVNPATRRAYTSDTTDFGNSSTTIFFVDADTLAVTPHVLAGYHAALRPAVDVAANRLYVTAYRNFPTTANDVVEIDEPVAGPVPLPVSIAVDPIIPGVDPVVHLSATSGFAPYPLPIRQIYFQVDATDGAWSYADQPGPTSSATLATLAPGTHTIHAFATDGQEATTSPASATPIVGPIASLDITVPPRPACSNGADDDGDGATDFPADPQCFATWDSDELHVPSCGLGVELVLAFAALRRLGWRDRR